MKTDENVNILDKNNESYTNVNKRKLKFIIKVILLDTFALLLIISSFYFFKLGRKVIFSETDKVDYSLSGNVDYKVHLKNNEYYEEEYLKSGMQYITSLIQSVDIAFNYQANASEEMDYEYKYNVSATTLVTSKNDKSKILFENKEYIIKDKPVKVKDKSFTIDEVIPINYDKYNDYILKYKKEYSLNTLFDLIVNIHVETAGKSEISDEQFKESKDFEVVIPLSEQIIDVSLRSPNYEVSGLISGMENKTSKAKVLYGVGISVACISVILLVNSLVIITVKNRKKSIYNKVIDKYLKEYDRAIVTTHKTGINEGDFDSVIQISSMQEMLDLHDNFQLPILYYEIIRNEKSYFIIIKDKILYKLVISKRILEENSGDN